MVKIKFCDPCQARLFSCHVLSCPRARVQPPVRACESMVSQIIFLDRICRRVFFINRSGRSGHWGEGLKANRELGQVWKITLPLEPNSNRFPCPCTEYPLEYDGSLEYDDFVVCVDSVVCVRFRSVLSQLRVINSSSHTHTASYSLLRAEIQDGKFWEPQQV